MGVPVGHAKAEGDLGVIADYAYRGDTAMVDPVIGGQESNGDSRAPGRIALCFPVGNDVSFVQHDHVQLRAGAGIRAGQKQVGAADKHGIETGELTGAYRPGVLRWEGCASIACPVYGVGCGDPHGVGVLVGYIDIDYGTVSGLQYHFPCPAAVSGLHQGPVAWPAPIREAGRVVILDCQPYSPVGADIAGSQVGVHAQHKGCCRGQTHAHELVVSGASRGGDAYHQAGNQCQRG
ncbi:hypothetical protein ACFLWX_02200 [Chloroflexota bacterium]